MAYHEVTYLFLFLPLVLIAYQIVPQKRRWCVLLLAGYAFFWSFSKSLVLVDGNVHVYALYRTLAGTGQRGRR